MTLTDSLASALELDTRRKLVAATHESVGRAIQALDSEIETSATDYFNHSFVPDLVLHWKVKHRKDDDDRQEDNDRDQLRIVEDRPLYLRYRASGESFAQDLDLLRGQRPIFLAMAVPDAPAQAAAAHGDALITQSHAVDMLIEATRADRRVMELTRRIVRCGTGVLDDRAAETVSRHYLAALRGIDATEVADREVTNVVEAALRASGQLLGDDNAELRSTLAPYWIAAGRSPERFPGQSAQSEDDVRRLVWQALRMPRSSAAGRSEQQ
jgi:hypothetical protein